MNHQTKRIKRNDMVYVNVDVPKQSYKSALFFFFFFFFCLRCLIWCLVAVGFKTKGGWHTTRKDGRPGVP